MGSVSLSGGKKKITFFSCNFGDFIDSSLSDNMFKLLIKSSPNALNKSKMKGPYCLYFPTSSSLLFIEFIFLFLSPGFFFFLMIKYSFHSNSNTIRVRNYSQCKITDFFFCLCKLILQKLLSNYFFSTLHSFLPMIFLKLR